MLKWGSTLLLALCLIVIFYTTRNEESPPAPTAGQMEVYGFDVGQGDSTFIRTKDDAILIDGGNNGKGEDVVRYLQQLGVKRLTAVVATHPDADHIGGLDTVLDAFEVDSVYAPRVTHTTETYRDFLLAVKREGVTIKPVKAGLTIPSEAARFIFLAPVTDGTQDLNSWSAVLRVENGQDRFLFMGDAPIRTEQQLLESNEDLSADVLKLGHHGAETSSSLPFLQAVDPKRALISAGKDNAYRHPRPSVLQELKTERITVDRTDKNGTIQYLSTGNGIKESNRTDLQPE
jgi:DNA internalization-related competence protein ComEC/Rec2